MAVAVPEPAGAPAGDSAPSCRNCGAATGGAYCPACGQETALALPSARHFLKDAAGRYVALDGRLWRTLAALLFHPGFLTREYFAGRRRRYVRPARLFLVLSLVLFAVLRVTLGMHGLDDAVVVDGGDRAAQATTDAGPGKGAALVLPGLSLTFEDGGRLEASGDGAVVQALRERLAGFNALPAKARMEQVVLGTLRYGPYAMFVLLPAFAFLLMLLYAGRHRPYPHRPRRYAEHLVFAAHNHAFFFLVVTLAIVVPWGPVRVALMLWSLVYGLASMRAVYKGPWLGVLARAWALVIAYAVLFAFAMAGLVIAAIVVR